jgi:hypothetical protein
MVTGRTCLLSTMDLHRSVYIYGRTVFIFIKNFLHMFSSATKIKNSGWGFDRGCGGGVLEIQGNTFVGRSGQLLRLQSVVGIQVSQRRKEEEESF